MEISLHWLIIGFLGQLFFSARFILQWIYSEINKKSIRYLWQIRYCYK